MPRRARSDEIGTENLIKKQFYLTQEEIDYLNLIQGVNNLSYQVDALHQILKEHYDTFFKNNKNEKINC